MPASSTPSVKRESRRSVSSSTISKDRHRSRAEHHRDRKTINLISERKQTKGHESRVDIKIERMDIHDDEPIDLRTPVNAVAPPIVMIDSATQVYVARRTIVTEYPSCTLVLNSPRRSILPAFPTSIDNGDQAHLLLANVPNHLLSAQERDRRCSGRYRPPFHVIGGLSTSLLMNTNVPSLFWTTYQGLFGDIVEHLRVDEAIIDYNYTRLIKCAELWAKERKDRFKSYPADVVLDQKDYALALEFFLQIDVDLFYMKTCSFRDAQPTATNRYLFCETNPEAGYGLTECGNCCLCHPKYDVKKRGQSVINFGPGQRHHFVNGYEAILNCPCSCETRNIIYVLTCPCGHFDYVGESSATLSTRVSAHRWHGNRIMHEAFIGQDNLILAYPNNVKSAETLSKDGMHLYRHSTRCRAAVQMFLDENPRYWRFVPMTDEEASQPHETILSASAEIQSSADIRDDPLTKLFIENLPSAPTGYRYSQRQYHLQQVFFKSKRDLDVPNVHLDLYNAKIIAVLPETGSTVLRQLVEALFITHAETKLNSSGRLVSTTDNHDAAINQESTIWCEGLVRRPVPTFTINMARSSAAVTTTPARPVKVEPRQE